jgi:hypothetical protein
MGVKRLLAECIGSAEALVSGQAIHTVESVSMASSAVTSQVTHVTTTTTKKAYSAIDNVLIAASPRNSWRHGSRMRCNASISMPCTYCNAE